jgi:NAD(P)-dependent dehydrogenase (short-subunit alcohol dehydrogenase family)
MDLDSLSKYVETNLLSSLYLIKPSLPFLRESKGRVVLISSGASEKGYVAWGAYSMVKAGMNSLARTLAKEEPTLGVYAIRPGQVDVKFLEIV